MCPHSQFSLAWSHLSFYLVKNIWNLFAQAYNLAHACYTGKCLTIMFMCVLCNNQKLWKSIINTFLWVEEKEKKQRIKGKTMAQWINLFWYNSCVNRWQLPLLCEKTGAIALVLPDLRQAGRQAGRWNSAKFRTLKLYNGQNIWVFLALDKVRCYYT